MNANWLIIGIALMVLGLVIMLSTAKACGDFTPAPPPANPIILEV